MKTSRAFTLMELMLVVVIVGIIASLAIPNYSKALRKSHEQDAVIQLTSINAANLIYRAQSGSFLAGSGLGLAAINSGLNINIVANGLTYSYTRTAATAYTATATYDESGSSNDFAVRVSQNPISATNPCCSSGSCPSVPAC